MRMKNNGSQQRMADIVVETRFEINIGGDAGLFTGNDCEGKQAFQNATISFFTSVPRSTFLPIATTIKEVYITIPMLLHPTSISIFSKTHLWTTATSQKGRIGDEFHSTVLAYGVIFMVGAS